MRWRDYFDSGARKESGLGFRFEVKGFPPPPIIENQMEKKMDNEMETGIIG